MFLRRDAWLLLWAVAYGATHHLGLIPSGLGAAGGSTRWVDWVDLAVPLLVLGPALGALHSVGTDRRGWSTSGIGALLYAQGHGVHLAANSIGNARGDAAPTHLRDEVVGHLLWYGGFALLTAVLARAYSHTDLRASRVAVVVAVLTGITWATNVRGADGLVLPGLAASVLLASYGWSLRHTVAGRLLLLAHGSAMAVILGASAVG